MNERGAASGDVRSRTGALIRERQHALASDIAGAISSFTGVSVPYEPPTYPEVEVNTERETLEESVVKVFDTLRQRGFLPVAHTASAR